MDIRPYLKCCIDTSDIRVDTMEMQCNRRIVSSLEKINGTNDMTVIFDELDALEKFLNSYVEDMRGELERKNINLHILNIVDYDKSDTDKNGRNNI